jgi:hypothetical protein
MSRGNVRDAETPCNLLNLAQLAHLVRLVAHVEPRRQCMRLAAVEASDNVKRVDDTWLRTEPIMDRQAGQMHGNVSV